MTFGVHKLVHSWPFLLKMRNLTIEWLCERTEYIDIFLFFCPSLNRVLFLMLCLLVEGECQILGQQGKHEEAVGYNAWNPGGKPKRPTG